MLHGMNALIGSTVSATDGVVGRVKDFYFDDEAWIVRYLVVETGDWLSSRKVLISPQSVSQVDWAERMFPVSMTRERVKNSPNIDTDKPVSRQQEESYLGYYGYPRYWGGESIRGGAPYPGTIVSGLGYGGAAAQYRDSEARRDREQAEMPPPANSDLHLRSCAEVIRYHVHATDGDIGHVQDLLLDDASWSSRYMVIDTSNWWLGHQVCIAPQRIQRVSWASAKVLIDLTRQEVTDARCADLTAGIEHGQKQQREGPYAELSPRSSGGPA
jgi:uncharacterized protein YrrD